MTNIKIARIVAVFVLFRAMALAQAIAPPIAEYRSGKFDGMLAVQNRAEYPMAALVETKAFDVDSHGQIHYHPLPANVHVSLGATSFIIRPRDSRMVFYKATVPDVPASFAIIVTMTRAKAAPGMRINFVLPHVIYVYQKAKLSRSDIQIDSADGTLHIHNLSQKLGRVAGVHTAKEDFGAFPLYSGQTRDIAMKGTNITVSFADGFKIARSLALSEHTIKNYLFRIFEKLGVSSRVQVVSHLTGTAHIPEAIARQDAQAVCNRGAAGTVWCATEPVGAA